MPEKTTLLVDVQSEPYPSPSYTLENVDTREETLTPSQSIPARKPVEWSRSSENAIMCSVLPDRVATWTVKKNRGMALCPLAAAVLVRAGILSNEDLLLTRALLERSRPSSPLNPTDPISAVLVSTFDALGDNNSDRHAMQRNQKIECGNIKTRCRRGVAPVRGMIPSWLGQRRWSTTSTARTKECAKS